MGASNAETVCTIVKSLGGPDLSPAKIEWADDLPAGKDLLKWIADQVPAGSDGDMHLLGAALQRVTLDHSEVELFAQLEASLKRKESNTQDRTNASGPFTYAKPEGATDERVAQELSLLQAEATRLKGRLQQMKTVSHKIVQTRKTLQQTLQLAMERLTSHQKDLDDLSSMVDSTLSKVIAEAHESLDKSRISAESLQTYNDYLAQIAASKTAIIDAAQDRMRSVEEAQRSLPDPDFVVSETDRISSQLQKLGHGDFQDGLLDLLVEQELLYICDDLEQSTTTCADVLTSSERDTNDVNIEISRDGSMSVSGMVQVAWNLDQLAILSNREKVLDEAQKALDEDLKPKLIEIQKILHERVNVNTETEALTNALLEEIEDAIGDAEEAKAATTAHAGVSRADTQQDLQRDRLKLILKELKALRPTDAPPLVLLENSDVDDEVERTSRRLAEARQAEDVWLADVASRLPDLDHPLLSTVYKNSPVNTSPPFASPVDLAELELVARSHVDSMTKSIVALQKEIELGSRAKRKLTGFVESRGIKQ